MPDEMVVVRGPEVYPTGWMPTQFDQKKLKQYGEVRKPLVLGDMIKHQDKNLIIRFLREALASFNPNTDHLLLCGHGFGTLLCTAVVLEAFDQCPVLVFDNRRKEFAAYILTTEDLIHE